MMSTRQNICSRQKSGAMVSRDRYRRKHRRGPSGPTEGAACGETSIIHRIYNKEMSEPLDEAILF